MVDRIQIGVGPRISYDESRRISFSGGSKEVLTRDQYQNSYVDFFNQTLGMPTLGEETGIDVSTPEIAGVSTGQDNSDGYEDSQSTLQTNLNKALAGDPGPFGGTFKYGADAYNPDFDLNAHLQKNNPDRVNIFNSLTGPLATNNFSDVDLGVVFDSTAEKATELPGSVGKTATELKREGFVKTLEANKEKVASTLFGMLGGIPGAVVGSFIGGKADKNGFGNTSFRPGGALGGVFDFLTAKQSDHISKIKAATAAGSSVKGFAMTIGDFGITRPPGSGAYTGNMRGMSHVQVKALEALSKGFVPSGYSTVTETGTTLRDDGYTTGQLSTGSFYQDDGSIMSADGRTAAYGYDRDAKALAEKFGLDYSTRKQDVLDVINNARRNGGGLEAGMITLSGNNITSSMNFYGPDSGVAGTGAGTGAVTRSGDGQKFSGSYYDTATGRTITVPTSVTIGGYDADTGIYTPPTATYDYSGETPPDSAADTGRPDGNTQVGSTGSGSSDENPGGSLGFGAGDRDTGSYDEAGMFASGGRIGMAAGGQMAAGMEPSGFIGAPPSQVPEGQTVADNVNTQKPEGTFVINAAAVEFAGEQDIVKMLNDAQKEAVRRGIALDNDESSGKLIDVAVSRGEVTVAPYLVKIIGEDRLTKINNRGKPETQERIQENGQQVMGAAEGGFLGFIDSINPFSSSEEEAPQQGFATVPVTPTGPQPVQAGTEYAGDEGDDIPETALQAPPAFVAQLEQHYKKPVTRTQNKKLYDKMSNEQLLAHMLMAETKSSTDPEEAMYAVGQTAIHRRNSNEPEFRKQKSLRDVLLKRLSKGAFEYAGMDVKRNKGLKENFTTNRANYERGLARATVIAQDLLGGEMESDPAVSPDVMWYTRQDAPNQWMRNNLTLVEIIGEHEFYKAPD